MIEAIGDGSGWVWIGKHTGSVNGVSHGLQSWSTGQGGTSIHLHHVWIHFSGR